MEKPKRRLGDRKDGALIRDIDPLHFIMPYLYRSRPDNEAYISERIDLEKINDYLQRKNAEGQESPYTLFQVLLAAFVKTIVLRPKMNRFIQGRKIYQRNELTAAFLVKKEFADDAHEAMAFLRFDEKATIESVHDRMVAEITACRSDKPDDTTQAIETVMKLPRFIVSFFAWLLLKLDARGRVPKSLVGNDPNYATLFISNLGSIKLKCGYHHLSNWGTNSIFCIIGEKKLTPTFDAEGRVTMKETVDLGVTVDERIADGYYYSKTFRLFRKLVQNPELLELPAETPVEY